jgi:hypothetical protein
MAASAAPAFQRVETAHRPAGRRPRTLRADSHSRPSCRRHSEPSAQLCARQRTVACCAFTADSILAIAASAAMMTATSIFLYDFLLFRSLLRDALLALGLDRPDQLLADRDHAAERIIDGRSTIRPMASWHASFLPKLMLRNSTLWPLRFWSADEGQNSSKRSSSLR